MTVTMEEMSSAAAPGRRPKGRAVVPAAGQANAAADGARAPMDGIAGGRLADRAVDPIVAFLVPTPPARAR